MSQPQPNVERLSGILLHPSSFPSRHGIGDFGSAAYEWVDWLASARQGLWQILPLGPLGLGNSPYSSISAFAGNPLFISLERLSDIGWIDPARIRGLEREITAIDYDQVFRSKLPLIREAARNFINSATGPARARYETFRQANCWWLDDYVCFLAIRDRYPEGAWNGWPVELARRVPAALARFREQQAEEMEISRVVQFAFWEQLRALHHACRRHGIRILGDVAIFISYDSADVWTHPELFQLGDNLEPLSVAGVPPDAFSATGQRWGNPLYRWDVLKTQGYKWWLQRLRWALETCDLVRLDHFRGFQQYWEIPANEPTAVNGRWVNGPQDDFFHAIESALGGLPVVAEDLGHITPDVHSLRERFGIPGMRVMQFGFGRHAHQYLPHWFDSMTVAYTGTHDNDTTVGWWKHKATDAERADAQAYLGSGSEEIHWKFVRALTASPARYSITPLQDILGLGSEARMNVPSRADGNWRWRYQPSALIPELAERLAHLAAVTDRLPPEQLEHSETEFFA